MVIYHGAIRKYKNLLFLIILVGQNDLNLAFEFKSRFHNHRPKSKRIGSTYEIMDYPHLP